jgi:predicted DNA-binding transcriptional regulator AlpA
VSQQTSCGHAIRQSMPGCAVPSQAHKHSASPSASPPIAKVLLTDAEGAQVYGVGLRTFLELQNEVWFPKPVMLGPRLKRHVRAALEAAVVNMCRRRSNIDPPCRSNTDPGMDAGRARANCG